MSTENLSPNAAPATAAPAAKPTAFSQAANKGPTPPARASTAEPPKAFTPTADQAAVDRKMDNSLSALAKQTIGRKVDGEPGTPPATAPTTPPEQPASVTPPAATAPVEGERKSILAPEAKPAAPVEAEMKWDTKMPENLSQKSQDNWKSLQTEARAKIKAAQDEALSLRQAQQLRQTAQPAEDAEKTALQARLKAAEDKLGIVDIQNHPEFHAQYTLPRQQALSEAKAVIEYNEKTVPNFDALLTKPMKEFNATVAEITKDMNSMDAMAVQNALRQAQQIRQKEAAALNNAPELKAQLQAKAARQQVESFDGLWKEMAPDGKLPQLQVSETATPADREEVAKYNQEIASLREKAFKKATTPMNEREVAAMASQAATLEFVMGHAMPRLQREYSTVLDERNALARELSEIRGKRPNPTSTTPGSTTNPAGDVSKMSLAQLARHHMGAPKRST